VTESPESGQGGAEGGASVDGVEKLAAVLTRGFKEELDIVQAEIEYLEQQLVDLG
jgi:hypothetical protein